MIVTEIFCLRCLPVRTCCEHVWLVASVVAGMSPPVTTLRQNGRHFTDDTFKCISLNENVWIKIKISLKFVLKDPISNIPALVQTMACRLVGTKPLSEPMIVRLLTHICVTRPQWVNQATFGLDNMALLNWVNIASGNVLVPVWHQTITWTKADLLLIRNQENILILPYNERYRSGRKLTCH